MKGKVSFLLALALSMALLSGCNMNNNDDGRDMNIKTRQDSPLRNDPESNDRNNRILGGDRDDRMIDDEDMNPLRNGNNGINGINGNGMNGVNGMNDMNGLNGGNNGNNGGMGNRTR